MSWHKHAKLLVAFSVVCPITGCGGSGEESMGTPDPVGEAHSADGNAGLADATTEPEIHPNQPQGEYVSPEQIEAIFAEARAQAEAEAQAATDLKAAVEFHKFYDLGVTATAQTITNNGEHFCIMTGFGGSMYGRYGFMDVGMVEQSGNPINVWKAKSGTDWDTKLYVRCVPRTRFTTNNGFLPFQHRYTTIIKQACGTGIKDDYLFNGNWAVAITGMGSSFNSGGDEIWIDQTESMVGTNKLKVKAYANSDCQMRGSATGFAVRNDGFPARFKGPGGTGTVTVAGEYTYTGPTSVYLGVSPEYFCYFSSIRSRGGSGPAGLLTQTSPAGFYSLTLDSTAYARVRCVAFDQT